MLCNVTGLVWCKGGLVGLNRNRRSVGVDNRSMSVVARKSNAFFQLDGGGRCRVLRLDGWQGDTHEGLGSSSGLGLRNINTKTLLDQTITHGTSTYPVCWVKYWSNSVESSAPLAALRRSMELWGSNPARRASMQPYSNSAARNWRAAAVCCFNIFCSWVSE